MKKLYSLFFIIIAAQLHSQTTVFQESFETKSLITFSEFCNDNNEDFFVITDGQDINSGYQVSGYDGNYYFAAQDTDGSPCTLDNQTITISNIDITGYSNLSLVVLVAEDDDGNNEDWDADTSVIFYLEVDNMVEQILQFSGGGDTNTEPGLDTNFDGIADSTMLSPVFQEFSQSIQATGSTATLVIEFNNLNAGDEDIAIDNIRIIDGFDNSQPGLTILSPVDGDILSSGTTEVNVDFTVSNFVVGASGDQGVDGHIHYSINGVEQPMIFNTNSFTIPTVDGETYELAMWLTDEEHIALDPPVTATSTFTVPYVCDLEVGGVETTCEALTEGMDTYSVSIPFTGGGTSTYTIENNANNVDDPVSLGGDNPSLVESGVILISGVEEGVDFSVTITGDASNSGCNITRNVYSATCLPTECSNEGDIIITEIFNDAAAVSDNYGEWFEVYNTTSEDINLQGWVISDLDFDEGHTINSPLVVPANGYAVLAQGGDTDPSSSTYNGGVNPDYVWIDSEYTLGNGGDEIIITCGLNSNGDPEIIDQVIYDGGPDFPDTAGTSMQLYFDLYDSISNDIGANWVLSQTTFGAGDLGTPGSDNFQLSLNTIDIDDFKIYPNPSNTGSIQIILGNNQDASFKIFNLLGERIIAGESILFSINIEGLQSGFYLIEISKNNHSLIKKLVVK